MFPSIFVNAIYDRFASYAKYLECQMLEEMCGAIGFIGLGSRAGIDPHAHRRRLRIGRILGSDLEEKISVRSKCSSSIGVARVRGRELTVSPFLSVVV